MRIKCILGPALALVLTLSAGHLNAQSADQKTVAATGACGDIDFFAGRWDVHGADGTLDATAHVSLGKTRCYATELLRFGKAAGGGEGFCFLAYSSQKHDWSQTCSLGNGDRYRFVDGRLEGNEMRFAGEDVGKGVTQIFSLYRLPDNSVREVFKESADGGKTWKTLVEEYWSKKK
jgi:hypothetical protein